MIVKFFVFDWWSVIGVIHLQEVVAHSGSTVGFSCGKPSHIVRARFMKSLRSTMLICMVPLKSELPIAP